MQKALTLHELNPHIQAYLLITDITAQLRALGSAKNLLEQRYWCYLSTSVCTDTSEAERSPRSRLTGAGAWVWRPAHSLTDFRAGSISPPLAPVLLLGSGLSGAQGYDSYASLRLETIGVKPSLNQARLHPKQSHMQLISGMRTMQPEVSSSCCFGFGLQCAGRGGTKNTEGAGKKPKAGTAAGASTQPQAMVSGCKARGSDALCSYSLTLHCSSLPL